MEDEKLDPHFSGPHVGAIAHLYRGEVYRSTIWRTRLDATTNWSVVSLGIALSISYSSPEASSLPLLLVAALIFVFLYLEARRYRYFNVWRARARWEVGSEEDAVHSGGGEAVSVWSLLHFLECATCV